MAKTATAKRKSATVSSAKHETPLSEHEVLIGELATMMTDDELLDLIDRADQSDDAVAFLKRAIDGTPDDADDSGPCEPPDGVTIVEKLVPERDARTHAVTHKHAGWILRRQDAPGPAVEFAGRQLSWTTYGSALAFESEDEATKAAWSMRQINEQAGASQLDFEIKELSLCGVPCRVGKGHGPGPSQFTLQLTGEQAGLVYDILAALRKLNVKHDGLPVSDAQGVVRYLLSNLG